MTNKSIKCGVDSCKHYSKEHCSLNDITVGQESREAKNCHETACMSFECDRQ